MFHYMTMVFFFAFRCLNATINTVRIMAMMTREPTPIAAPTATVILLDDAES